MGAARWTAEGDLEKLYALMVEHEVFTKDWEELRPSRRLTGGSSSSLQVIADGAKFGVPEWGAASVRDVYDTINGLVPELVWEKLRNQRDRYRESG